MSERITTVIVASDDDLTADSVMMHLDPEDVIRLDPALLHLGYTITAAFNGTWRTRLETPDRSFDVGAHTSIWWRKPTRPEQCSGDHRWIADENTAALLGLLRSSEAHIWVNDPAANEVAAIKAPQLALARRVGLDVPDTLITNDGTAAAKFVIAHRGAVNKAMRQKYVSFIPTVPVEVGDDFAAVGEAVHQFQQRIDKSADVRLTAIGERLFAVRIESPGQDVRVARREEQTYEPVAIPRRIARAVHTYMREARLTFACWDFVIDRITGIWYFLEVNPNGEFGYIEAAAKIPLSRFLAEHLRQAPAW